MPVYVFDSVRLRANDVTCSHRQRGAEGEHRAQCPAVYKPAGRCATHTRNIGYSHLTYVFTVYCAHFPTTNGRTYPLKYHIFFQTYCHFHPAH